MKSRFLQLVVPFLLVATRVQANDSEAVDEGGVLVLKKSEHVIMESEDLSISPHSVHVAYRFRNTGPADVDTLVAFPIGTDIRDADEVRQDSTDLLESYGFKLVVDGVARSVEVKNQVTPARQEVVFYWRQLFPAGKPVSIEHEYSPKGGSILIDSADSWKNLTREYCIDDQSVTTLRKREREQVGSAHYIHYILKTGANWAGPIHHFHLTIRKDRPEQLVFLCAEGVRRQDALTFVIDKTDFVPRSDLKIIFIAADVPRPLPNQAMKPTAPWRDDLSVLATDPARSLSPSR